VRKLSGGSSQLPAAQVAKSFEHISENIMEVERGLEQYIVPINPDKILGRLDQISEESPRNSLGANRLLKAQCVLIDLVQSEMS
jgi:hypothetical protein